MITELEYITQHNGASYAIRADKNVAKRNAWHLKTISGNALPPVSVLGSETYGIAGKSYGGMTIGGREIEAELYADGYSAASLQGMMADVSRVLSASASGLGVLRLTNHNGDRFRIAAKCTELEPDEQRRRSVLFSAVFDCPFSYFEGDTLNICPLFAVTGGKEYPQGGGLERPYMFGNIEAGAGDQTVTLYNAGDVPAPCTFRLFGAGMSKVEITNKTTGAAIVVDDMPGDSSGIVISTDVNDQHAVFASTGEDASRYVSVFSNITDFVLMPGENVVNVKMTASSITTAGTSIEWRGRYTTCL